MAERVIQTADITGIERRLDATIDGIQVIATGVGGVDTKVEQVNDELSKLTADFHAYVKRQEFTNNKLNAQTVLADVRAEIERKFGHYNKVRRSTTGILQADDLGIVRKSAVTDAAENVMIETPGYWLAPCLVALAAWINDQPELAEKAVREAIKRNDEKTSLFFALVCRRAGRGDASLKWVQRYLENQDEENLNRNTVIILDAYASGLLGADSEGVISEIMTGWLDDLVSKPGFVEQQRDQWSKALLNKKKVYQGDSYMYLPKYSKTWPQLVQIMEGAELHATIVDYFMDIFEQEASTKVLREQLDDILTSLVTDFDDEELPLRKQEKLNELIIQFEGDVQRARMNMQLEENSFDTRKDFTQLLTDSAMRPEISHANSSTQKFAIALTKDWIKDAYQDITAKNRMKIPSVIEVNIGTFNNATQDGSNEQELVQAMRIQHEAEKQAELAKHVMSAFDQYSLYAGAAIGAIGFIMMLAGSGFLGLIAIISGIGLVIRHFSRKSAIEKARARIEEEYNKMIEQNTKILLALLAEVFDFREEFREKDSVASEVMDFLDQISPDQYIRKLSGSTRRMAKMA